MILILNAGSSSLKFKVYSAEMKELVSGKVEEIGPGEESAFSCSFRETGEKEETRKNFPDHKAALAFALSSLASHDLKSFRAVGHRVVHGGSRFQDTHIIDAKILTGIRENIPLAPLHNPANIAGIEAAMALFPAIPQVAVFDTAFHATLPPVARQYALPQPWRDRYRRYGFHGISHRYIRDRVAEFFKTPVTKTSLISAHLGNGASVCAIRDGISVETSMGYTPLAGLVMGTRSGDIDPGIVLELLQAEKLSASEVSAILNKQSGLQGMAGDNDMRQILEKNDPAGQMAVELFCHRLAGYIASYSLSLPPGSPLVFTAGIGENSADVRAITVAKLKNLGYFIDEKKNKARPGSGLISPEGSAPVLVLATDEELQIALETASLVS